MNQSLIFVVLVLQNSSTDGRLLPNKERSCSHEKGKMANGDDIIYETVRYGHFIQLECCCCEGDVISWTKWSNATKQWQEFVPDRSEVKFMNNKHIISVQSSTFEDRGLYKCRARNGSNVMNSTTFLLDVVACDKLARGPYPISPSPCVETLTQESNTLTLPCTGYFGCKEEGDIRIATWFVSLDKNKKDDWLEAKTVDKRYNQVDFQRDGSAVQGSNLTIDDVSAVDFNRKFMCILASPQILDGQTSVIVTLKHYPSGRLAVSDSAFSYLVTLIGVSAVACISVVVNAVMLFVTYHGRLRQNKSRINKDFSVSVTGQKWTPVELRDVEYT